MSSTTGSGSNQVTTGQWEVDLSFNKQGTKDFANATTALSSSQGQFAIVLDHIVQSAPTINAPRFGGQAQISGNFTPTEASNLVTVLKFGSLPLEIREVGFSSISATLGLHFLNQTILAGIIGIALGSGIGFLVNIVSGFPISLPWWSFALGLGFSAGVGIFFGMLPAWRASTMAASEPAKVTSTGSVRLHTWYRRLYQMSSAKRMWPMTSRIDHSPSEGL